MAGTPTIPTHRTGRRRVLRSFGPAAALTFALSLALPLVPATARATPWYNDDITGAMGNLQFTMTRAADGKTVTAKDYRGKVTLLYFGYTNCPDVCPTTLANAATILQGLGNKADDVRFLFVTVDPNRDTLAVLKDYTSVFAPQIDGLRGTPDAIDRLARRYRISYSVTPDPDPEKYEVTHSAAIYVFDQSGKLRLRVTSLASDTPDIAGTEADLARLVSRAGGTGIFGWLRSLF